MKNRILWLWYIEKANELFLDIDEQRVGEKVTERRKDLFYARLKRSTLEYTAMYQGSSASEGHWHVAIELGESLPDVLRAAWRLRLGSDIFHEAWNMARISAGEQNLIIRRLPLPGFRPPDMVCGCAEKHGSNPQCEPGRKYRDWTFQFFRDAKP